MLGAVLDNINSSEVVANQDSNKSYKMELYQKMRSMVLKNT